MINNHADFTLRVNSKVYKNYLYVKDKKIKHTIFTE